MRVVEIKFTTDFGELKMSIPVLADRDGEEYICEVLENVLNNNLKYVDWDFC